MHSKPHVIKDFDKLDSEIQEKVLLLYPNGFTEHLVTYTDPKTGQERFALPYETEDRYYMIRMDAYIDTDHASDDEDDDENDDDILNIGRDMENLRIEEDDDDDDDDDDVKTQNDDEDGDDDDEDEDDEDEDEDEDDNNNGDEESIIKIK